MLLCWLCDSPWAGRTWARRCWGLLGAQAHSKSWTPAAADSCETAASSLAPTCTLWTPGVDQTPIHQLYFNVRKQEWHRSRWWWLPCFAWACSWPRSVLDSRLCNATDELQGTTYEHKVTSTAAQNYTTLLHYPSIQITIKRWLIIIIILPAWSCSPYQVFQVPTSSQG